MFTGRNLTVLLKSFSLNFQLGLKESPKMPLEETLIISKIQEEIQNQYEHKHSEVPELADLIKATLWKGRLSNQLERWNKLLLSSKGGN